MEPYSIQHGLSLQPIIEEDQIGVTVIKVLHVDLDNVLVKI